MSDRFFSALNNEISKQLARDLRNYEKYYIKKSVKKLNMNKFANQPIDKIMSVLSKILSQKITTLEQTEKRTTYTEKKEKEFDKLNNIVNYQQKEMHMTSDEPPANKTMDISIEEILGLDSIYALQKEFQLPSLFEKHYIILDSENRDLLTSTSSKFIWNYTTNVNPRQGFVNSSLPIKNTRAIQLYQPLMAKPTTDLSLTARVSILLDEFFQQAFIAGNNRRYHWLTRVFDEALQYSLHLEGFSDGLIKFNKPVQEFDTLSLSFGSPIDILEFYPDRANATFTYGGSTTITTDIVHNLSAGEYVRFDDFTTDDPTTDASIIEQMNSNICLEVTGVPTATTFTITLDTSLITPTAGLSITVFFENKRVIIPMEFTCEKYD